jgi:hypothetical protein
VDGRVCRVLHAVDETVCGLALGQLPRFASRLQGQAEVVDEPASETELGVGSEDEPGPPVGLFGHLQRWCRPPECPLHELEGVLDVEPAEVGALAQVEIGFAFAGPPQPQRVLDAPCRLGQVFDLDPDHAAFDDRRSVIVPPAPPTVQFRMQVVPGAHRHVPVVTDAGGEFGIRCGPGRFVGQHEGGAVAFWTTNRPGTTRLGVGMEDTGGAMRTSISARVLESPWPRAMPS